jgi:hypothetical protein
MKLLLTKEKLMKLVLTAVAVYWAVQGSRAIVSYVQNQK